MHILKNLKFSKKIMAILGITSFLIILAFGVTSYLIYLNDLKKRAAIELKQANESAYNLIETSINESVRNTLRNLAEKTIVLIESIHERYKDGKISRYEAEQEIRRLILNPKYARIGGTGYLNTSNIDGVLKIHPFTKQQGKDISRQDFMKDAIKKARRDGKGYIKYKWKNPGEIKKRDKAAWIIYFKPFDLLLWSTAYKDEFKDVIDINMLSDMILDVNVGKTGYNYVIDGKGKIVVHPKIPKDKSVYKEVDPVDGKRFVQEIVREKNGKVTYSWKNKDDPRPREKIVYYKYSENLDWIIASGMYTDDFYKPIRNLRNILLGITLLALLIVFFVSKLIGKSLSKPIQELDEFVRSVKDGNQDAAIPEDREDEIGNLAKTFKNMTKDVIASQEALKKEKEIADTARKKAEEARKSEEKARKSEEEARKEAERASSVKTEFLINMNHEIRSPLTSILGDTNRLMTTGAGETSKEYLQNIKYNCITLKEFIDNIIYISAAEILKQKGVTRRPNIKTINLCSLLGEIRGSFSYKIAKKNLHYCEELDEGMPQYLKLDKERIKQAVFNLLSNAVKYTQKGHIKLTVKMDNLTGGAADLIIAVEDTGAGIAGENKEKIFNAFQQLDTGSDGLGLGLHIAKGAVKKMGGQISFESEVGKGSVFTIHLKNITVSREKPEDYEDEDIDISTIEFEGQRILIVDDRADHRGIFKEYLAGMNLSVLEAEDGEKAWEMVQEHRPDVVIMDLHLGPGKIDGIQATEKIKKHEDLKNTIIIAFSDKLDLLNLDKCKELFDGRIDKFNNRDRFIMELSLLLVKCKGQCPVKRELDLLSKMELTPENQRNLPQIVEKLDGYLSLWENTSKEGNFDKFASFGNTIKELGSQFDVQALIEYGEKIIKYVETPNIAKIKVVQNYYPMLIDNLKNWQERE